MGQRSIEFPLHRSARTKIKKTATQSRQTLNIYPADHIAGGAVDKSGTGGAETDGGQDLAGLVWKHFAEDIIEAMRQVQEALAPEEKGSSRQVRHQKG